MKVSIPGPLLSYTRVNEVQARGRTLAEVLDDLDRQFPGIRFRVIAEQEPMRPHMRFFVNGEQAFGLGGALRSSDEVTLVQALSGG